MDAISRNADDAPGIATTRIMKYKGMKNKGQYSKRGKK